MTAAAVLLLAASACSTTADPRIDAAALSDSTSPLAELFGVSLDEDVATGALAAEDEIADCMARAGFDYTPAPPPGGGGDTSVGAPSLEQVQRSGYGIADSVERQLAMLSADGADPNRLYVESLSPDQIKAYQAALTGITDDEIIFDDAGTPIDPVTRAPVSATDIQRASVDGCASRAYGALFDPRAAALLSSDIYLEAQQLVQSDDEMLELTAAWSRCMASSGYPVRSQSELIAELDGDAQAILADAAEASPGADGEVATDIQAMIDELRTTEVDRALIDFDCSQELFERAPAITRRVEAEFIRDNEDRLVDLLDQGQ